MVVDAHLWSDLCVHMAARAVRRCGTAYSLYQRIYSESVDARLKDVPVKHQPEALKIAARWDYVHPEERCSAP